MVKHNNSDDKSETDFSWLYTPQQKADFKTKIYCGLQERLQRWKPYFATTLVCLLSFLLVVFWQPETSQELLSGYSAKPTTVRDVSVQAGMKSDIIPIKHWPDTDSQIQSAAPSKWPEQEKMTSLNLDPNAPQNIDNEGALLVYNDALLKQCSEGFAQTTMDNAEILLPDFEYRRDSHTWVRQIKIMEVNGDYEMANREYGLLCSLAK